jgi:PBSX family phage terminase large subunit
MPILALEHRYHPIGKCAELFAHRGSEILISGPAGTGKSRACLEKMHAVCLKTPGVRALIVRKTRESLSSTALVTYREHVAKEAILSEEVWFYGGSKEEAAQYRYANGSSITIGGMDKSIRIMSSEYDIIYVQEATELTLDDWEALTSRLRNNRISFQQILADCNPDAPTHWLKMRSQDGVLDILESTHRDNPTLFNPDTQTLTKSGEEYLAKLKRLTGVRRRRLLLGEWVAAEGIVYEGFDPDIHIVKPFPIPDSWPRYWGIDFGYTNPFVLQCWAQDPSNAKIYLYRELYYSKRLVEQHAEKIMDIVAPREYVDDEEPAAGPRVWIERQPRRILADHDAEGRATFTLKTGLRTTEAHKAVTEGIQAVEERLVLDEDGVPGLMIFKGCTVERDWSLREAGKPTSTEEEFPGYAWAPPPQTTTISVTQSRTRELPGKENDHGMDTARYVVAHLDLKRKPGIRAA